MLMAAKKKMLALISWVPVATTGTQRLSNTFSMVSFVLKVFLGVCVCVCLPNQWFSTEDNFAFQKTFGNIVDIFGGHG